ncbi:paraquat-inducible protein A [Mesorhizobium sp. WSM2239]|uniref:Paraquat-inducible protein A n=2 Tax=unclassified Mesorhizobium TaxID=325217 RepID=A0AAU8DEG0_9HYPH
MRFLLPITLLAAAISFAFGLVLPLIRIERLFVFADEPSLLAMISGLWAEGDIALAIVIALFSVIFPAMKLGVLYLAAYAGVGRPRIPDWFRVLANWSMLDVVLVALVIFAAKTSGLATAFTKPGLWFFAASAVLTAAASGLAKRQSLHS